MPYFRPHPNGHEFSGDWDETKQQTMTIQEEDDCFVAGFLRPLDRPEAEMEPQRSSNPTDVGSSPTGATTSPDYGIEADDPFTVADRLEALENEGGSTGS